MVSLPRTLFLYKWIFAKVAQNATTLAHCNETRSFVSRTGSRPAGIQVDGWINFIESTVTISSRYVKTYIGILPLL